MVVRDRFPAEGAELWTADSTAGLPPSAPKPIEGWAVTYRSSPNYSGRILVPGAFADSLTRRPTRQKPLTMGYEHSTFGGTNPIGSWGKAVDGPDGLLLSEGKIEPTTQGKDVRLLVDAGVITGLSVGFLAEAHKMAGPGEEVTFETPFGERAYQVEDAWGPVLFVTKGELLETSLVSAPADDEARMAQHLQSLDELERASLYQQLAELAERYRELDKVVRTYASLLEHQEEPDPFGSLADELREAIELTEEARRDG